LEANHEQRHEILTQSVRLIHLPKSLQKETSDKPYLSFCSWTSAFKKISDKAIFYQPWKIPYYHAGKTPKKIGNNKES